MGDRTLHPKTDPLVEVSLPAIPNPTPGRLPKFSRSQEWSPTSSEEASAKTPCSGGLEAQDPERRIEHQTRRRRKVEFATQEALNEALAEALQGPKPGFREIEAKMSRLRQHPEQQLEELLKLEKIPPEAFQHIVGEEQQLVALPKIHLANDFEAWYFGGRGFLQHACTPRIRVEVAKQFPLEESTLYLLLNDLKDHPEFQTMVVKSADSLPPQAFGLLQTAEAQRLSLEKINFRGDADRIRPQPSDFLNSALTEDLKLEIAQRCPSTFPIESTHLVMITNDQPRLQLELIRSATKIYPLAFSHIVTEEGQKLAAEKLGYPEPKDVEALGERAIREFQELWTPQLLAEYRKDFSAGQLGKAALTSEIQAIIRKRLP